MICSFLYLFDFSQHSATWFAQYPLISTWFCKTTIYETVTYSPQNTFHSFCKFVLSCKTKNRARKAAKTCAIRKIVRQMFAPSRAPFELCYSNPARSFRSSVPACVFRVICAACWLFCVKTCPCNAQRYFPRVGMPNRQRARRKKRSESAAPRGGVFSSPFPVSWGSL